MPKPLRETKRKPEGVRREIHRLMSEMDTSGVVVYRNNGWAIFMPHERRQEHAWALNFIVRVLRKKYPDKVINGRFLEHKEKLPVSDGVYSIV